MNQMREQNKTDLAIIGSGPAALTAAIYAARADAAIAAIEFLKSQK